VELFLFFAFFSLSVLASLPSSSETRLLSAERTLWTTNWFHMMRSCLKSFSTLVYESFCFPFVYFWLHSSSFVLVIFFFVILPISRKKIFLMNFPQWRLFSQSITASLLIEVHLICFLMCLACSFAFVLRGDIYFGILAHPPYTLFLDFVIY
jgi:hypothetical protein